MKKIVEKMSPHQKKMAEEVANLALDRVLINIDSKLSDIERKEMEEVFASTDDSQKLLFIKKYAPDFGELLEQETIKIVNEIKNKTKKI